MLSRLKAFLNHLNQPWELTQELQALQQKQEGQQQLILRYEELLRAERQKDLTLEDFQLNKLDTVELTSCSAHLRMALFKVCEIVRLCEHHSDDARKAVERLRNEILRVTKGETNILPHEETKQFKSPIEPKERSPLLPRYDLV